MPTGEHAEVEQQQAEREATYDDGYRQGYAHAMRAALLIANVGMRFIPYKASKARVKELTERNHAVRDIKYFLAKHAESREGFTADEIVQLDDARFRGSRDDAKPSAPDA